MIMKNPWTSTARVLQTRNGSPIKPRLLTHHNVANCKPHLPGSFDVTVKFLFIPGIPG
ncbi:hypothetical protein BS17DRAFT_215034 [Gyrodon lividus]|nr:hypothetical protein BS17DRAFT_215034 [Gyrodon lividus]